MKRILLIMLIFSIFSSSSLFSQPWGNDSGTLSSGNEGEVLLGVKVPVFSVIEDINERKYNLTSASIESKKINSVTHDNLRMLQYEIVYSLCIST